MNVPDHDEDNAVVTCKAIAGVKIPGNDDTLSGSEDGWVSMTGPG